MDIKNIKHNDQKQKKKEKDDNNSELNLSLEEFDGNFNSTNMNFFQIRMMEHEK